MKIALPTNENFGLEDTIAEHFGRCQTYTFLDETGKLVEIIDNTRQQQTQMPPQIIKKHGADILICQDLGVKAKDLCEKLGIKVWLCPPGTVRQAFELWQKNQLKPASTDNVCPGHE